MPQHLPELGHVPPPRAPSPVEQLQAAGAALHGALEAHVHSQRIAGASWAAIGRLLGCSRQAAWERWRYLDDLDLVLRVSGTTADGSRRAVVHSPATGAVVGQEQTQQVALHGLITDHHPALTS